MKALSLIKKIFASACVIFTIIIALIGIICSLAEVENIMASAILSSIFTVFVFSLVLALMNKYLYSKSLVFGIRLLFHYIVTALAFYLLFIVGSGFAKNGGSSLTIMIVFTVVYALFAAIISIFFCTKNSAKKKKNEKKTEYKKMF